MTNINISNIVAKMHEEGNNKAQIEGFLQWKHRLSVNEAKSEVQKVLGKGNTKKADLTDVVKFVRENYGKLSKQDLIAGMCDVTGQKQSSMNHMYNYIKFAIEFAKQEVEASK